MRPRGLDDDAIARVLVQAALAIGRRPVGNAAGKEGTRPGPDTPLATIAEGPAVAAQRVEHEP